MGTPLGDFVDLAFPLSGAELAIDSGYTLFSALSRLDADLRERKRWGIHPVRGQRTNGGRLELDDSSFLKLRLPAADIPSALAFTGKTLDVDGDRLTLGVPRVFPLAPAANVRARLVVVKGAGVGPKGDEERAREEMTLAVRTALAHLPLEQDPERIEVTIGRRHVMKVGPKRKKVRGGQEVFDRDVVVGFEVALGGLEATASLVVQAHGIGGKRHMGCGLFVPPGRRG